jgi:hypothetical protein
VVVYGAPGEVPGGGGGGGAKWFDMKAWAAKPYTFTLAIFCTLMIENVQ